MTSKQGLFEKVLERDISLWKSSLPPFRNGCYLRENLSSRFQYQTSTVLIWFSLTARVGAALIKILAKLVHLWSNWCFFPIGQSWTHPCGIILVCVFQSLIANDQENE